MNMDKDEAQKPKSTLKEYEDILVYLYGLPIKNSMNRDLLKPDESPELK